MRFDYYSDLTFYNGSAWDRYFTSQADETILYDVLVVGSGTGGGILADATSNHGLRTLVLEAGPIRHLVNITDLPLPNLAESMDPYRLDEGTDLRGGVCFNLGGRSIYWSAVIPRMREWERRNWPDPIRDYLTRKSALKGCGPERLDGYQRAERLFRLRPEESYPAYQRQLLADLQLAFPDHEVTQLPRSYHVPDSRTNPRPGSPDERTTGVFSTAALLTDSVMNPGRAGNEYLDVAVSHLVDRVVLDGGKAVAVEALDLRSRVRRSFRAKHVVLAGGTTESARLAITSGVQDQSERLGRGLTDHPEAEVHFVPHEDFQKDSQGNVFLRPTDPGTDDEAAYSCELALNWQFWDVHTPDDDRWRQEHHRGAPPRSTIKFLFHNRLEERNTVTVSGSVYDVHLEPPRAVDLERPRALAARVATHFGSTLDDDLSITPWSWTYHLAGSMAMGTEREHSVVDTDLRFWAYDNLWCCDLSVFPDVPASNPSLTLGALAQRLASTLRTHVLASRRATV